jgi:hypothetical protein
MTINLYLVRTMTIVKTPKFQQQYHKKCWCTIIAVLYIKYKGFDVVWIYIYNKTKTKK